MLVVFESAYKVFAIRPLSDLICKFAWGVDSRNIKLQVYFTQYAFFHDEGVSFLKSKQLFGSECN